MTTSLIDSTESEERWGFISDSKLSRRLDCSQKMNSFMKYDHGTLASAFFEHTRNTDAEFRRKLYDLRVAMYKTTYKKEFHWPDHITKSSLHQVEPEFTVIPKPNEDYYRQLYTPKIIFIKSKDNKGIIPPIDYSVCTLTNCRPNELKDSQKYPKSLYQDSYINRPTSQVNKEAVETPEEWVQRWKNECHNVRDAGDLVQDLSNRIISAQKLILNRKRIGDI